MQILVTVVAIVILAIGITVSQRQIGSIESSPAEKEEVLSENVNSTGLPTPSPEETITPFPTSSPQVVTSSIHAYIYPGSNVINSSSSVLSLESDENVDKITDWYKDKIQSAGMNIKTFVVTKANDNVLNKLGGSNANQEVNVEIEKKSGESNVSIRVTIDID